MDQRTTADDTGDVVVFLIGMRIGSWWRVGSWLPVAAAMPRMLRELAGADLGLLDARTYVSGRVVLVVQYWASLEQPTRTPGPPTASTCRPGGPSPAGPLSPSVGIFHETYLAPPAACESVYVDMPVHGLARAVGSAPVTGRRRRALAQPPVLPVAG